MAASAWLVHDAAKEMVGNKFIDFDNDTFYMVLGLSTSNMHAVTTAGYANITDEVATNFGYTQGLVVDNIITNNSWSASGSVMTWDSDDVVWTADGGSITARYAAVVDDIPTTPTADPIICSSLLDTAPADVQATDGNTFTVQINVAGIFTLA